MDKSQRIRTIYDQLATTGSQTVSELADALGVTAATVRRDLKELELQKRISRSYGSARVIESHNYASDLAYTEEQKAIARAATNLIQTGHMVILHGGKINRLIAHELPNKSRITVITNSPAIFDIVKNRQDVHAISIGGLYSPAGDCLYGHLAESSLHELRADMVFFEPSGIDLENMAFTHDNVVEIPTLRVMSRTARSVILNVSGDIIDRTSGVLVERLNIVSTIVANANSLPEHSISDLQKSGIKIIVAGLGRCDSGEPIGP